MKRKGWFRLLIALQALFLLGMAGSSYATAWVGQEIKLKTIPVDPRDFLYGDYVILNYSMTRLDPGLWQGEDKMPPGGTPVYTLLRSEHGYYEPAAAYPHKVAAGEGEVVLKGVVAYSWENEIVAKYGLERYYVPEGTGKALEKRRGDLIVTVKVAPWGQAQITGVEFDDDAQ